jgi:hypothetical protein
MIHSICSVSEVVAEIHSEVFGSHEEVIFKEP